MSTPALQSSAKVAIGRQLRCCDARQFTVLGSTVPTAEVQKRSNASSLSRRFGEANPDASWIGLPQSAPSCTRVCLLLPACRCPTDVRNAPTSIRNHQARANCTTTGDEQLVVDVETVSNATVCAVKGGNALAIVDSEPFHTHSISLFQSVRVTIRSSGCYTDGLAQSHTSHHIHNR